MFNTVPTTQYGIDAAMEPLLKTPAPAISATQARYVMDTCYPGFSDCSPMAGERDTNFRLHRSQAGHSLVLKFINSAELVSETAMQIEVLKHLSHHTGVVVPSHYPIQTRTWPIDGTLSPGPTNDTGAADWAEFELSTDCPIRVRAYSFLEGRPGTELAASHAGAHALGVTAARLDHHLAEFDHPAAHRDLLWDTCHASRLKPLAPHIDMHPCSEEVAHFLDTFESRVSRHFSKMPHQVIHNDLSPSNFLVDETGARLTGILDFGDMVYAPRVAEVAIAASYLPGLSASRWQEATQSLVQGYESITPLLSIEHDHLMGMILARLAQRILITSWRAAAFPANEGYILRSRAKAIEAFTHLYHSWK